MPRRGEQHAVLDFLAQRLVVRDRAGGGVAESRRGRQDAERILDLAVFG
jgi:hypothetical protein